MPQYKTTDARGIAAAVFASIADKPRWVQWKLLGDQKVPIMPGTSQPADTSKPETWRTLAECRGDRLGVVFNGDGIWGLDLDGCRDPDTGKISEWAREIIDDFVSYAEISPSGTGIHIFLRGGPKSLPYNVLPMEGPAIKGKRPQLEAYVTGRYFTVTGEGFASSPLELCEAPADAVRDLIKRLKARAKVIKSEMAGRDDWLFSMGRSLLARGCAQGEIEETLTRFNANPIGDKHPNFAEYGPLDDRQLKKTIRSVMKKEPGPGNEEVVYDPAAEGPVPVGYYKDGASFALCDQKRRILLPPMSSGQLMAHNKLVGFAPPEFWAEQFRAKEGTFNSYRAGLALIAACKKAGPFDPIKVRGRGVWSESGRVVVNLGEPVPPGLAHTYLCFKGVHLGASDGFDAAGLLEMWRIYRWEDPHSAELVLGFAFVAPLSGMLAWRPHEFAFGDAGGGKTAVCLDLGRLLEPMCLITTGESSEAGIRQELGHDALPVIIDDFDSDKDNEESKRIYRLMRAASSADATTLRGTAEGKALAFIPRTMFFLGGINVKGQLPQDADRIVPLKLLKHDSDRKEGERLRQLRSRFHQMGRQWCAYVVANAGHLLPAITALDLALQERNQRTRLTFATLLAGAFVALHGKAPTEAEAAEWAKTYGPTVQRHADEKGDRNNAAEAWAHLLAHVPYGERHSLGAHMWFMMSDNANEAIKANSKRVLRNHGLEVVSLPDDAVAGPIAGLAGMSTVVRLANPTKAPLVNKLYEKTPWADGGWKEAIRTLPGAAALSKTTWHCGTPQRIHGGAGGLL